MNRVQGTLDSANADAGDRFEFVGLTGLECDWVFEDPTITFAVTDGAPRRIAVVVPKSEREHLQPLHRHRIQGAWRLVDGRLTPVAETVTALPD